MNYITTILHDIEAHSELDTAIDNAVSTFIVSIPVMEVN